MFLSKSPTGMGFQIAFKKFCTISFFECCVTSQYPWFVLTRMNAFPIVVFSKTTMHIIRDADIPMPAILGFERVDKMHSG